MGELLSEADWQNLLRGFCRWVADDRNHDPDIRGWISALVGQVLIMRSRLPRTADGEVALPGDMVYSASIMDLPPWRKTAGKQASIGYRYVEVVPREMEGRYYSTREQAEEHAREIGGPDIVCVRPRVETQE